MSLVGCVGRDVGMAPAGQRPSGRRPLSIREHLHDGGTDKNLPFRY
jgi:hypothetical protein